MQGDSIEPPTRSIISVFHVIGIYKLFNLVMLSVLEYCNVFICFFNSGNGEPLLKTSRRERFHSVASRQSFHCVSLTAQPSLALSALNVTVAELLLTGTVRVCAVVQPVTAPPLL
jgi:hypothetical protein